MTLKRRLLRAALAACVLGLSGTLMVVTPPPASAAPGECPPGYEPVGPGIGGEFFDQNVAVFAGGNFSVGETAAESEGVLVALGNATFQRTTSGTYNVGVVGQGSGVPPNPGTDMLVVGGTMSGNSLTTVDVGFGIGGNVVVGGSIAAGTSIQTSGGSIRQGLGPAATTPYTGIPARIQAKSAEIAALPDTGTVEFDRFGAPAMRFIGDFVSDPQVFTIPGNPSVSAREISFERIPDGAAVYINVTAAAADLWVSRVSGSPEQLVDIATHTLWNFPAATSVNLRGGAQLTGSILVPNPASSVTNSLPGTNGRIYVNGNLQHIGQGTEMHNYPFLPDDELDCLAILGGFAVDKVVNAPAGVVVDPTLAFSGTYECTLEGAPVGNGNWSTTAGAPPAQVADGLPVGAVCSLEEVPPAAGSAPPGHVWQNAVISPASVTIADDGTLFGFTVTNTLAELAGGFSVTKTVAGDPDGLATGDTFTGTWSCVDGTADPVTGVWSVTAGGPAQTVSGIALGSECTLTEDTPTPPDTNHVWQSTTFTPANPFTVTDATTTVAVTVTNTLAELAGGFSVTKTVAGDPDGLATGDTFTGTWSCVDGTADPVTGVWSVTAGGPAQTVSGIALGSECTLTEDTPTPPDTNHVWQSTTFTPANPFTVTDATTTVAVTVTNTLAELAGGFSVTKTVAGDPDGLATGDTFTGTWSCVDGTADPVTGVWSVTAGGPAQTVSGIALGSECTLTEDTPTPPDTNHVWQSTTFTPANPFTVTDATTTVAVTVTNTLAELAGGFSVTKTVAGDPDGLATGDTFTGTWSCVDGTADPVTGVWSVTAGGPAQTVSGIALGSECTLTEDTPTPPDTNHVWQSTTFTPANPFTVTDATTTVAVTVTNTLAELAGGFSVTKTVAGDPDGLATGDTFTGTWSCVDGTADPVTGVWSVTAGGPAQTVSGIALGSECTLTEDTPTPPDTNHVWQSTTFTPANPFTVTDATTTVAVTVTNTLAELAGGFSVTKTVAGDPDGLATGDTFTGTWSCVDGTADPVTGVWSVTAGGPAQTVSGIALGSECTLTEDTPTPPDTNHVWQSTTFTPANPFTVTDATTTVAVTVTNTLAELAGGFSVTKTVAGDPDGLATGDTFTGTWSCVDGTADPVTGVWSVTAGGPAQTVSGIALGSECTLTEDTPTPPDTNHVWQSTTFTPANPFTVTDATTTVAVTVTNTLAELAGGFSVTKTVAGDPDGLATGDTFTGTWSCVDGTADPVTGVWSVTAGGPAQTVSGIALGSECTLTEDTPTPPDTNHVWQSTTFTPANPFTVTDATTTVAVTVTNTLAELAGGFSVTKTVAGDPDGLATGDTFTGTWSCVDGTADPVTGVWSVTAGGPAQTVSGIALGSECTLTEDTPTPPDTNHVWQSTTFTPANPFTVTDATTTVAVTVTNTLAELAGGFSVTKTVVDQDGTADPTLEYTGTYTCTLDGTDVTPDDDTWSTTAAAPPVIVTDQIPLGSVCTLEETQPTNPDADHEWLPPVITPSSVTIRNADTSLGFTVTNSLVVITGEPVDAFFTIEKVVDPVGAVDDTVEFTGTWSCVDGTADPVTGVWSVTAGGPAQTVSGIALGSECTLTETPPVSPDGNHVWQPAVITPTTLTIEEGARLGFTVTNTLVELTGGLTVTKILDDPEAVMEASFEYSGTFSCVLDEADVTPTPNTWTTTAGAGPVVVTDEIPLGSVCRLSETPPAAPDASHEWQPAQITPASVTITDATTPVGFTVTNTLTEVLSTGLDTSGPATVTQPTAATTDPNNTTVHSDVEADLASTGPSTQLRWLAWIGLLAVIAGMALVWPFRRARRHER